MWRVGEWGSILNRTNFLSTPLINLSELHDGQPIALGKSARNSEGKSV